MPRRKPTSLENSGRVVRKAAEVLKDRKWIKGTFGNPNSGMCAVGAISFAITGNTDVSIGDKNRNNKRTKLALNSIKLFAGWLGSPVVGWNDSPGRTKEEVIQYMLRFADEVDPRRT